MAAERTYTAACPACGAPVVFQSAQSTHAVCSFCRSTVVRDGDTLARVGKMAEVFEDFSPLQLMASGRWQGKTFTLVGRLQYRGQSGPWTEWYALFDDGSTGWLAEDNGAYVFARSVEPGRELPRPEAMRLGHAFSMLGASWQLTSNEQVALVSAQGELPKLPPRDQAFSMVELRSADNEVLSIDYGSTPPLASRGLPVALEQLAFQGLRDQPASEKNVPGRQFACPQCGAQVELRFTGSKSITCKACKSLIDLTQGMGGELSHAVQDEPVEPAIPLGRTGQLDGVLWQIVGFQHRLGTEPDDPDEHFGWEEYLLYNRRRGFCFLVDSTDGWSLVKPTTGAPTPSRDMLTATYLGTTYQQQFAYSAQTTFVEGEFYWPVQRGQRTANRDYAKGDALLSMEQNAQERTWSIGRKIASDKVADAFALKDKKELLRRGDSGPTTPGGLGTGSGCGSIMLFIVVLLILFALLKSCDDDASNSGRSGYFPGSSGGGGGFHK